MATINIGTLMAYLEAKDNGFSALMSSASTKLTAIQSQASSVGTALSIGVTAPIAAMGIASLKAATDFNAGMANVATLIPGNTQRVNELKTSVQEMAVATGKSTSDLTGGLYQVESAFGDTAETVSVLNINARAAAAGLATTKEAIDLTSAVTKGYGDTSAAAVQHASDLALTTVRLGQTTFPELAASIGRVTPLAAALNVTQEELFGTMATFTGVTGGAAEVSTQLRGVLQSLLAPTDDMNALLTKMGVTSGQALIQQKGLQGAIAAIVQAAKDAGQPLQKYLSSIEGQTLALAATGGQAATFTDKIQQMKNAVGATDQAFRDQTEGVNKAGFQWSQFEQKVVVTAQRFGDQLIPILLSTGHFLGPLFDLVVYGVSVFGMLPGPVQGVVVALLALTASAGPAAFAVGKIGSTIEAAQGFITGAGAVIFALGNTVPVLTARIWLLDTAQKAATISAGTWNAASSTAFGGWLTGAATRVGGVVAALASLPVALSAAGLAVVGWVSSLNMGLNTAIGSLNGPFGGLIAMVTRQTALMNTLGPVTTTVADAHETLASKLAATQKQVDALNASQRSEIDAGLKLHESYDKIAASAHTSSDVVSLYASTAASAAAATTGASNASHIFIDQLANAQKALAGFSAEQRANIEAGLKVGKTTQEIATQTHLSADAIELLKQQYEKAKTAADQLANKNLSHELQVQAAEAIQLAGQIEKLGGVNALSTAQQEAANKVLKAGSEALQLQGRTSSDTYAQIVRLADATAEWRTALEKQIDVGKDAIVQLQQQGGAEKVDAATRDDLNKKLADGAEAMRRLKQTADPLYTAMSQDALATANWRTELTKFSAAVSEIPGQKITDLGVNFKAAFDARVEESATIRQLTMSDLQFQVDAIQREAQARKDSLEAGTQFTKEAYDAIDAAAGASMLKTIRNSDQTKTAFAGIGAALGVFFGPTQAFFGNLADVDLPKVTSKTSEWGTRLSALSQGFSNLAQTAPGALGSIASAIGTIIGSLNIVEQASSRFWDAMASPDKTAKVQASFMDLASSIIGGVSAVAAATSSNNLGQNIAGGALSGAMTGASIAGTAYMATAIGTATAKGAMVAGIWGAAAGAIVGIMIAVFRGRDARHQMEMVGKEWGEEITQGVFDKIKASEDSMFMGDRVAATLFNMKDMIDTAGGLNDLNFDKFLLKLHDVFSMIETGKFTLAQANQVMADNFDAFAKHVVESNKLASEQFVSILELNAQSGLYAQNILDFIGERMTAIGSGIAAMMGPLTAQVGGWHDQLAAAQKAVDDLTASGQTGTEDFAKAQATLNDLTAQQAPLIAQNAAELDDMKTIALAAYAKARAEGLSYVDAVNKMGDGIDAINAAQQQLGITEDNVAFEELGHFRDRVNQNKTLVTAAEALNQETLALSDIGALNADALAAVERQGLRTYDNLRAAGFTEQEALAMEADWLETVAQRHIELGIPIDDNTAALINQADQYGLLQKNGKSMTDILKEGFSTLTEGINRLIETLGGVPIKVQSIADALKNIPTNIPVNIDINTNGLPEGSGNTNVPDASDGGGMPSFDRGSHGLRNFGTETVAKLHGWEAVSTASEYADLLAGSGGASEEDITRIVSATMVRAAALANNGAPIVIRNEIGGRVISEYVVDTTNKGLRNGQIRVPKGSVVERAY